MTDLNKIKPYKIANECSPVHVENVIKDLVEQLKVAKNLAEEVMSLNSKAGEIGEGKCKNMQAIAEMFLKDVK